MSTLALGPLQAGPPREPGGNAALLLAVAVHLLLFAFLFFGVNWNTQTPAPVMAELWSQIPNVQPAPQPAPLVQPPQPEPPKPVVKVEPPTPKPVVKVEPPKPLPKVEAPKPDIALEQEKERKKREAEAKAEAEKKKQEADKLRREMAEAERKRLLAQLNEVPAPTAPSAPIKGPTTSGDPRVLTAAYQDRVRAAIRPKINYVASPDITGNPTAEVEVQQMPTGEVMSVRVVKSSGVKLYDEALERAIKSASPLPKPENGAPVPRELKLRFKLYE
ncbi:MAG TPA: cell envelope integrity protein TolA [Burkholderiales bacterium]|nr:cell envelope integrity protein TolA [Burkholderiales bacterium]